MCERSFANGNGASNSQGPMTLGSPVPTFMRQADWLLLQEFQVHQLLMF
jgi:hypothetical protein